MKLIKVEKPIDGKEYLTPMKHGWLEGVWIENEKVCIGYYWNELEWYPEAFYEIEAE